MNKLIKKADILIEALPYIRNFAGKTVVIKYGGHAMIDEELKEGFAEDVVLLKYVGLNPIIVHGGGPQINKMLDTLGIEAKFIHGIRVTDKPTMEVVEMVLGGKINKEIVALLNQHGGKAVGLTGKDGGLFTTKSFNPKSLHHRYSGSTETLKTENYGLVGEVSHVNSELLLTLQNADFIPVIAPIGVDAKGTTHNINADMVAGSLAAALQAEKLLMLSDVKGIRNANGNHVSTLSQKDMARMVKKHINSALLQLKLCLERKGYVDE